MNEHGEGTMTEDQAREWIAGTAQITTRLVLRVKRLHPAAVLPAKAHAGDAGWDLAVIEDVRLWPGCPVETFRTGLAIEIPAGYCGLLWDRSGLGGLGVSRLAGCIDHGFTGEVLVVLANHSAQERYFPAGTRVCQLLILPVPVVTVVEVDELAASDRGEKGFGSTGA